MSILNLTADISNVRLDKYLADEIEILSRTKIKECIEEDGVSVNGRKEKPSYMLKGGESIRIEIPEEKPTTIKGENIPLDIVHEDDELIIVNKPAGLVIHPGAGAVAGTLVNALVYHFDHLSQRYGNERPGIVHRLDEDTSGVLVVAKTDRSHLRLAEQFSSRTVEKTYLGVAWGRFKKKDGIVKGAIARHPRQRKKFAVAEEGRPAETWYKVVKEYDCLTLIEIEPKTGRTHQIRVHMASIHHPIFADETYGGGRSRVKGYSVPQRNFLYSLFSSIHRQALHAKRIAFHHPKSGHRVAFKAPLPHDFQELLDRLELNNA